MRKLKEKTQPFQKPKFCEVLFIQIIGELSHLKWTELEELAEKAEVSSQTLWNWAYGETCNPHFNTFVRVITAMGYELKLVGKPRRVK